MMPQNHFVVAAVVTLVAVVLFYPDLGWSEAVAWMLVAGIVAAVIDMDVILIVRRAARDDPDLEPWTDIRMVAKDFPEFLMMLSRKGLLRTVSITHVTIAVTATVLAYLLAPSLFIPVTLGAWSHMATDVPYLRSIKRAAGSTGE